MKKIISITILFAAGTFLPSLPVFAVSITPTTHANSPTAVQKQNTLDNQINELKDKIASRVAQLKLVEKRGIIGTVTAVSPVQITVNDLQGNTVFIDVDDITQFSSPGQSTSFGISDITKGMRISVLGTYNKDSERILARFVDVIILSQFVSGEVSSIDKVNYQFKLTLSGNKQVLIDVENVTRTFSYTNSDTNLVRSGFSKVTLGERAYVIGYPDKKTPSMIVATRILLFPDLPQNPNIPLSLIENSPTPTSSPTPVLKKSTRPTPTPIKSKPTTSY